MLMVISLSSTFRLVSSSAWSMTTRTRSTLRYEVPTTAAVRAAESGKLPDGGFPHVA
jgi:hypothetical protein